MYLFLIPLLIGFVSNVASTFTTTYSEKWGNQTGTFITIILKFVFGIPVWTTGFGLAVKETSGVLFFPTFLTMVSGWFIITSGALIIIIAIINKRGKAGFFLTGDYLIKSGIYSLVRHPIYVGTIMEFCALFVLRPSLEVGIAAVLGIIWINIQSWLEEKDLVKRVTGYEKYIEDTPRFFPNLQDL